MNSPLLPAVHCTTRGPNMTTMALKNGELAPNALNLQNFALYIWHLKFLNPAERKQHFVSWYLLIMASI
jgi:hypothetical protein